MRKNKLKSALKILVIFMIFFVGTCCLTAIDTICKETTGEGGKLVFDVEKVGIFN